MPKDIEKKSTRTLRYAARTGETVQRNRARLLSRVAQTSEAVTDIPPHLLRKMLNLKQGWKVLDFTERDWRALSAISEANTKGQANLLAMAAQYILLNAARVNALSELSEAYSDGLLAINPARTTGLLDSLDDIDRQSVLILKLQGHLKQAKYSDYVDYLRSRENAHWLRTRFLNSLVYHQINTPSDSYVDTFLSYMLPQAQGAGVERAVAKHVLRDDLDIDSSMGFRAYVALACHPYDAMESLTNYFEAQIVRYDEIIGATEYIALALAEAFPASRLASLLKYSSTRLHSTSSWLTQPATAPAYPQWPKALNDFISAFIQCDSVAPDIEQLPSEPLQAIARMRWSRYPLEEDFDTASTYARSYGFLESGRLADALLTSMYMLPRDSDFKESRSLVRLHMVAGLTTPYIWGAPRGRGLMRLQMTADPRGWLGADLHAGAALQKRGAAPDRTWFHAVHWELQGYERTGHVRNWLAAIRRSFPIKPRFLTGLDWTWIEKILPKSRITPFRDNPNGPYTLLLRDIEEHQRDTTLLRTAIEPQRVSASCDDFVRGLMSEYGASTTAFVRFFLTPETIMLLGLAPNMTAALSERISALEACAAEYSFGELLSEDDLKVEQQTLTSALMLMNVNANQFDVPWPSFKRDAAGRARDNYNTYSAHKSASRTLTILLDEQIPFSHKFANGKVVDYLASNSAFNLAAVILTVIDAFYDHPSYGIEAILSTRFRHDTLRREYASALSELRNSYIAGVMKSDQVDVIDALSGSALGALDRWLVNHMQTSRPGFKGALFDFTPTASDLDQMLARAQAAATLEDVLDQLVEWITVRLDASLIRARDSFQTDCLTLMSRAVDLKSSELRNEIEIDPAVLLKLTAATNAAIVRLTDLLVEWIKRPEDSTQPALTFEQLKQAVDGRFERAISAGDLAVELEHCSRATLEVPPEKVKLYFDLLSEIVSNSMKYAGTAVVRVSMQSYSRSGIWGYRYCTPTVEGPEWKREIQGHQYRSLSDALFREGNSGLVKISAIAASIMDGGVTVKATRHRLGFELEVPLGRCA